MGIVNSGIDSSTMDVVGYADSPSRTQENGMSEYYKLLRDFGDYPTGLVVFVVESRTWMQMNECGDYSRHSDGKWIGPPNLDNPRDPKCSWCVERSAIHRYPGAFERVYV